MLPTDSFGFDCYFVEDFLIADFLSVFALDFFFAAFFVAFLPAGEVVLAFCLVMIPERSVLAFSSSAWRDLERFLPARLM